jgi:hypothetical protein
MLKLFITKLILITFLITATLLAGMGTVFAQQEERKLSAYGFFESEVPMSPIYTKREMMTGFSAGDFNTTSQTSVLNLYGSLAWLTAKQIQIGGEGGLIRNTLKGQTTATVSLAAFAVYNFSARISNSYFARGGLSFSSTTQSGGSLTNTNSTNTGLFIGGGRRFELWHHVSLSPEVRFHVRSGNTTSLEAKLLNFSILF